MASPTPRRGLARPEPERGAPRVLYLLGHPRCGSTLAGNLIGEIPGTFHAGELHYLWKAGLPLPRQRCGCGLLVRECAVWRQAFATAFGALDMPALEPAGVDAATAWGLPGVDTAAMQGLQERALGGDRVAVAEYRRKMERLYRGLAETTGASLIVDSSKWPHDARLISGLPGLQVSFVHLIREPWGSVYSRLPRDRPDRPGSTGPPSRARVLLEGLRWLKSNVSAERIARQAADRGAPLHRLTIRYEDFVADVAGTLERIAAFAGVAAPVPVAGQEVVLTKNHTTGGNRNRWQSGPLAIRADQRWRQGLRGSDVRLISLVTWPYRLRFGYTP
jgi:hypothetical protein